MLQFFGRIQPKNLPENIIGHGPLLFIHSLKRSNNYKKVFASHKLRPHLSI